MNETPGEAAQNPQAPARKSRTFTAAQKAEWVLKYQQSGLSLSEFSSQSGLEYRSLYRWARKQSGTLEPPPKRVRGAVDFAELKLPLSAQSALWAVELTLPNGTVLRLTKETPPQLVDQLLRIC